MSAPKLTVLAVDLGAESGRVMAVHFDGRALQVEEVTRFANRPVAVVPPSAPGPAEVVEWPEGKLAKS